MRMRRCLCAKLWKVCCGKCSCLWGQGLALQKTIQGMLKVGQLNRRKDTGCFREILLVQTTNVNVSA